MFWKHDPGPCPVDDSPHTTCVAPTLGGGRTQSVTVPLERPGFLRGRAPERVVATFRTDEYKRAEHGQAIAQARKGKRR